MIMTNEAQCVSLNYLMHELIENAIEFRFVAPFTGDGMNLRWQSHPDQVEVVSRIVGEAIEKNSVVLIGAVDQQEDKTAYFVGFVVEPAA